MTKEQYYWFVRRQEVLRAYARQQSAGGAKDLGFAKIQDFVFSKEYEALSDEEYAWAVEYVNKNSELLNAGGRCSGVISPDKKLHGRNLDWYYNNDIAVIAKTKAGNGKHASVGVCLTKVSEADVKSGAESELTRIIPFRIDDGINDAGLTIQVNVTPFKDVGWNYEDGKTVPDLIAVRYVLDNFEDAEEAARAVAENGYYTRADFCYHWMISDKSGKVFLVEDGQVKDITERPFLTNFRISSDDVLDGQKLNWNHVISADPHGMGLERYETILSAYPRLDDSSRMMSLMHDELKYTNAYDAEREWDEQWHTEACQQYVLSDYGFTREYLELCVGIDMDKYDPLSSGVIDYNLSAAKSDPVFAGFIYAATHELSLSATRFNDMRWQTTWTSLYDRSSEPYQMSAVFQENGLEKMLVCKLG